MQLKYGTYAFDVNSTLIVSGLEVRKNAGGQPYAQTVSLDVEGVLTTSSVTPQNDLSQQASALQTALSVWGKDLIFYCDDGSASATKLLNAGSITGVRILNLRFPTTQGPEYAVLRHFSFRAEAEYPLSNTAALLLSFQETLTFSGGGPIYRHRMAINGPPQKQLVYPASIYACTQQGTMVGYRGFPTPLPPLFPQALKENPRITKRSPERKGQGYQGYTTEYSYTFESATVLSGVPNLWIN